MNARGLLLIGTALLASASFGQAKVIGRLGQALETATIYASPSSKSRAYYKVKAFEKLIVQPKSGKSWLPVVMENGKLGYIPTSKVAVLPYNVTIGENKPAPSRGTTSRSGGDARAWAAEYSLNYIGTPYKWGGNDIKRGIDCSAFVQQLYGKIGLNLPRTAAEQARVGQKIERLEDLRPGDRLYFWDSKRGKIGHTGIYLGDGYFCHSSVNNKGVDTDSLHEAKWRNMLVAARR